MKLWRSILEKLNDTDPRDWPAVPATIEVIAVLRQEERKGHQEIVSYLATLTYFYKKPELQSGDYRRVFDEFEADAAQAWADSHKNRTVQVHVHPDDPSRSVLLDEELLI